MPDDGKPINTAILGDYILQNSTVLYPLVLFALRKSREIQVIQAVPNYKELFRVLPILSVSSSTST